MGGGVPSVPCLQKLWSSLARRGHPEMLCDIRRQERALGRGCQEMQVVAREGWGSLKWSHGSAPGGAGEKGILILSIITIWAVDIASLIWLVRKSQRRQKIKLPRVTPLRNGEVCMDPLHITRFLFAPIMMGEAWQGDLEKETEEESVLLINEWESRQLKENHYSDGHRF